jgi:hypothetical protein
MIRQVHYPLAVAPHRSDMPAFLTLIVSVPTFVAPKLLAHVCSEVVEGHIGPALEQLAKLACYLNLQATKKKRRSFSGILLSLCIPSNRSFPKWEAWVKVPVKAFGIPHA